MSGNGTEEWMGVSEGWRKLHEELHNQSGHIAEHKIGHVGSKGEMINVYKILFTKLVGKEPLGRPRHRQENDIKMDL